ERLARVRAAMAQAGLTHLIAYSNYADPGNARWLSGFFTSHGDSLVVVPLEGEPMLVTNWVMHDEPMHSGIYGSWIPDTRVCARAGDDAVEEVADVVRRGAGSPQHIGRAGQRVIPARVERALHALLEVEHFVDADALLLDVRRVKSPLEIERMRRAARITGAGIGAAMAACQPGVTEQAVVGIAHGTMFAAGAEHLAFDSAVASGGKRAGVKHCTPTWRAMQPRDLVFLDMGATVDGYYADVSRCVAVGEPTPEGRRLLAAAEDLYAEVARLGRPGKTLVDWHADAVRLAGELGFAADYKRNGFGHGLGCMLFERPNLRYGDNPEVLEAGMTFAFEPMIVVDGLGTGVVEETVLVTADGIEPLSGLPTRIYSR
ncbi:MAG TPA: Xaa-Pro peptidase family protein, partial [Thermomicrobiaceae bacterium]|nr:Xaa-Pro peptidase family protein [Thermomicrobiaceae bacterium]